MSETEVEEKRKIELPRALREIVKILSEEGPKTYQELSERLGKDETTIIRQVQKLIDMEICVKVEKENKAGVALAEGIEVDEEGNVYVPSPFEEPTEKLKQLLEEAGVKGKKLRWITRLVETNPSTLQNPQQLYDTLIGAGIRRHLAEQIVKAFFGTDFVPLQPPAIPQVPYQRQYYPYQYYPIPGYDRDLMRLEMRLERLLEEIREKKEEKPSFPVIRRIKTDETGKPVEVVEEPAWFRSDDSARLVVQVMQEQSKSREELLKTIYNLQQETGKTISRMLETIQQLQQQQQQQLQQLLLEMERKRVEEVLKTKEELYKRDAEWMERFYKDRIEDLRQTIESVKRYYEEQTKKILEDLKKEWEFKEKIRELEERKGIRDVVIGEIREVAKDLREATRDLRQQVREYMEQSIKRELRKEVPTVTEEEKKKVLEALRRVTGVKVEEKAGEEKESGEEIKLKVVEK